MAEPFAGGLALGNMLFGRADETIRPDQLRRNYDAQAAFAKARQERAKMLARDAQADTTRAMLKARGFSDPDIEFAVSNLGMAEGQPNLGTLTGGLQDLGDMALREERQKALDAGELVQANKLNAVITDKAYEPVVSEDGNLRPSGVELGDESFTIVPLPQTLATIEQKEAQSRAAATRAAASANASNATADLRRRTDPNRSKGGRKPNKPAAPITATNPKTGEKLELRNGKWVKI